MLEIRRGWNELGRSVEDRPIRAFSSFDFDSLKPVEWILVLGGTHGDERATVPFLETFTADHLEGKDEASAVMVLPVLNPDGYFRESRYNARCVDLNRNLPELWSVDSDEPSGLAPLSEPESQLLYDLLMIGRPSRIVSLHWALSEIDADENGFAWAKSLWENLNETHRQLFHLKTPGVDSFLPGSLGTFCRRVLKDSTALITLELPYHPQPELNPLPDDHFESVMTLWNNNREVYWNAVYPAVENILLAAMKD